MNPEMKNMLLSLDGVYEPKGAAGAQAAAAVEAHQDPTPVDTDR